MPNQVSINEIIKARMKSDSDLEHNKAEHELIMNQMGLLDDTLSKRSDDLFARLDVIHIQRQKLEREEMLINALISRLGLHPAPMAMAEVAMADAPVRKSNKNSGPWNNNDK